mgnify:CR=1 FL=1
MTALALTSCVSFTTPTGAKLTSVGGQVQWSGGGDGMRFASNHEKSFSDAANVAKHGIWGLGVVRTFVKQAGSVLRDESANSLAKSTTTSNNATKVANTANNNALEAVKSGNELKALKNTNALKALKITP